MEAGNYRGFELAMHDPGIALITFDQPERLNGMTQGMKRDLIETLLQAQMDDGVRVVVFTGSGRASPPATTSAATPRPPAAPRRRSCRRSAAVTQTRSARTPACALFRSR